MFAVQKRASERSAWHTCSHNKKKCRYIDLEKARKEYEKRTRLDREKHPLWQYRIYNTLTNKEEVIDM